MLYFLFPLVICRVVVPPDNFLFHLNTLHFTLKSICYMTNPCKGISRAIYLHLGKPVISKATLKRGECCDLPTPVDLIRHLGITQGLFASTSDLLSHHSFGETQVHTKELDPWFPNFDSLISNFWSMDTKAYLVIHKMIITKIEVKKMRLLIEVIFLSFLNGVLPSPHSGVYTSHIGTLR